jgi:KAP family P-loop domain
MSTPLPSDIPVSIGPTLRLRPPEIEVAPDQPFQHDRLGREPFVKATVELLQAIREPFVIALNAPWGSGKTTTLRLLEPELTKSGVTNLSFNAWEIDEASDPLVPLVAAVHDRLLALKGYGNGVDASKVERWKKVGSALAKQGAIAAVKVASAGLIDFGTANALEKAMSETATKAGEEIASDLVDLYKRERNARDQFRALLGELTAYLRATAGGDGDHPPVVLVIDELDRCRPTFAVAMLERIKHFFDVPGLVFLLALDLEQLKASTRKVYGSDLDASEYLRRFVDLELALPSVKVKSMVNGMLSKCGADDFFSDRKDDRNWVVETIDALAQHFGLSLRVVQRMVTRLMLVVRQTPRGHYMDPTLSVFMIFLRMRDPALLSALVAGRIQAAQLMGAVSKLARNGSSFHNSHTAKIIEAHVLYAHERQHEYVKAYLQQINDLNGSAIDSASVRMSEIGRMYELVRRDYFRRGRVDLARIVKRIDLVALDEELEP